MRILFITTRQAWPAVSGAQIRGFNFARALGEHGFLTYVFFRDTASDPPKPSDMPFCEEMIAVSAPPTYSPDRVIRGVIGRWPLPVLNYTSSEMTAVIEGLAAKKAFDVVHFDSIHMAAYAPLIRRVLPGAGIFFNWHNIESEGMWRYAELSRSPLKGIYAKLTARKLERMEAGLIQNGYGNVVCSERERTILSAMSPDARVAVVQNGVDTEYFNSNQRVSGARNRIVFVGLMAYHANVDAVVWFVSNVWPKLRELYPDKTLTIVGARPAAAVLALKNEPGVEVTGTVPDVRPYYADAFAAIAPLRTGAGTRLKILEAMAAGAAVVSTRLGAEGLDVTEGKDVLFAETPDEWIAAFGRLRDDVFRESLVSSGRQLVCSRYDWQAIRESLFTIYSGWLARPS